MKHALSFLILSLFGCDDNDYARHNHRHQPSISLVRKLETTDNRLTKLEKQLALLEHKDEGFNEFCDKYTESLNRIQPGYYPSILAVQVRRCGECDTSYEIRCHIHNTRDWESNNITVLTQEDYRIYKMGKDKCKDKCI